jgi:hypothetical protein
MRQRSHFVKLKGGCPATTLPARPSLSTDIDVFFHYMSTVKTDVGLINA